MTGPVDALGVAQVEAAAKMEVVLDAVMGVDPARVIDLGRIMIDGDELPAMVAYSGEGFAKGGGDLGGLLSVEGRAQPLALAPEFDQPR